jgi:hypothetical protein
MCCGTKISDHAFPEHAVIRLPTLLRSAVRTASGAWESRISASSICSKPSRQKSPAREMNGHDVSPKDT